MSAFQSLDRARSGLFLVDCMPRPRTYRLLCPIARALDKLGDRWTLLILRDLHAGPARFGDIAQGLPGMASNLLTSRLEALQNDGLVVRRPSEGRGMVYALTSEGEKTGSVLFALARFGSEHEPPEEIKKPGNLRTVVVTLKEALRRGVAPGDSLDLELLVDEESFGVQIHEGAIEVTYGPRQEAPNAVQTSYEPLIAAGDGRMDPQEFFSSHLKVIRGNPEAAQTLFSIMGRGFAALP